MVVERTFINLVAQVHPRVVVERLYVALFDNFYMLAISFGISIGAIFLSFVLYKLVLYCGLPKQALPKFRLVSDADGNRRVEQHDPHTGKTSWRSVKSKFDLESQEAQYKPIFYSVRSSAVHFAALTVKYGVIVFGLYTAFGVAGVSFFSLAFSVGIIGLIGTYAFGLVLYNVSGSFVVSAMGQFVENMVIKISGVKGTILEMTSMNTVLRCKDPKTGEFYLAYVPNRAYNEGVVLRFPAEEDGNEGFTVSNIDNRIASDAVKSINHRLVKVDTPLL